MNRTLLLVSVLSLSACAAGPDYKAPQSTYNSDWVSPGVEAVDAPSIQLDWWTVFDDPLLESFIARAVQENKDVAVASANLRRARALYRESRGPFWPQVAAGGGVTRSKSNGDVDNLYDAGFDASWEVDVFGGTRRAAEAARARTGSALAGYDDVMLSTLSEVARNYYEARGLQKRITNTQTNTRLLRETSDLIRARVDAGEATEFDLSRAQGEYELTRARLPNLEAELYATIFNLSVLLGEPPEALLDEMKAVKPLPTPPDVVPVGLRGDILRRRPDVRMAERELAAAVADIGVETSELFPKFFLTGDIGSQARLFGDLFTASGGLWSLGSIVQWSVFEGGAIRARIDAAKADKDAALASYEKTVLTALADAESALTRYGRELETRKRLTQGVQSRRRAVSLARTLFDAGEEDYLAVLDAQRELISSEDDLIQSETATITKLITLYTALGGGWELYTETPAR